MSKGWQFILNETSVHFLLSIKSGPRQKLMRARDALASDPLKRGDFETRDATGRAVQLKVAGPFLISYWPDAFVRELRVINIEWI